MSSLSVSDFFFFFCKQKTAYEMRISDWSSDVCSSDLTPWLPGASSRTLARRTRSMSPSCWAPMSEPPEERSTLTDRSTDETRDWAVTAARTADEKQAQDAVVLQVGEVLAICGCFVTPSAAIDPPGQATCHAVRPPAPPS